MKKTLLMLGGAATMALVISGCSSVNWEKVGYTSPANEVNLKANPSVKIVAIGNQEMLTPLVGAISSEFSKSGQIRVTEDAPDYWLVFNGEKGFRTDDQAAAQFNRTVEKVAQKSDAGGREYLQKKDQNSSAATALLSVAVYGVTDLSPVYYFDIALYDADFKQGKVRDGLAYDKKFTDQIIAKVKDAFLTQNRIVETALPKNADSGMKKALIAGDSKAVISRAAQVIPQDFDAFLADITAGKYKEKADEMESKLSNYYVLALAREIGNFEPANLNKLHAQHVAILNQTNKDGLSIACPNSLARIESKLKLLQALK